MRLSLPQKWYQKLAVVLVLLYLFYALVAFLLVATWGKHELVDTMERLTGRQVRVASLLFNPFANSLSLSGLQVTDSRGDILRLGRLFVDLELLPLLEKEVYLRQLSLDAPYVHLVRMQNGDTNLQHLLIAQPAPEKESQQPVPEAEKSTAALPLVPVVANLDVQGGVLDITDESVTPVASLTITPIALKVHDLSLQPGQAASFLAGLTFPQNGDLSVSGRLVPTPLALTAKVDLQGLEMAQFNPWVAAHVHGRLASGQLQSRLDVQLDSSKTGPQVKIQGQAQVANWVLLGADNKPLLSFDTLAASGFSLDADSRNIVLSKLAITGLASEFTVYPNGKTTVDRLLVSTPATPPSTTLATTLAAKGNAKVAQPMGQPETAGESTSGVARKEPASAGKWTLSIDDMQLAATRLGFHDESVKPAYQVSAEPFSLDLKGLNTSGGDATLDITTKLGGYAPLSLKGMLAPFTQKPKVDLDIQLKGYDMTHLSPYTGRFLGNLVDKGQLGIASQVSLAGSRLASQTQISADNFYLGKNVPSKEAIHAPVKFGLSILRDRDGNIDLPLKIDGDLSDPGVSVHGLVLKALLNVLTKAATAPLSVLSLLSGGVSLEQVAFDAGSGKLNEKQVADLAGLAKVLAQRPGLALGLAGRTSAADVTALEQQGVVGKVLEADLKTLATQRGQTLKLTLMNHYQVAGARLYLEQPQTGGDLAGVALNAINK
jgi:hypothetical protein